MNRQQRFINFERKSEIPGPGKYESSRANSSSMSFAKAERIKIKFDKENITGRNNLVIKLAIIHSKRFSIKILRKGKDIRKG